MNRTNIMDKASSVSAALNAGKQPSQQQINAWVNELLQGPLLKAEKTEIGGELSESGRRLATDLRNVLETYKLYGERKNGNSNLQETLWHLRQADLSNTSLSVDVSVDQRQAKRDYRAVSSSLRTSLEVLWQSAAIEGSGVFADFASFVRLSLADTAELLSDKAAKVAQDIRTIEDEVQAGDRNAVGVKEKLEEEQGDELHVKFEESMDAIKDYGSSAIATGEQAADTAQELTERSCNRLREVGHQIAKRASEDEEYRRSLDTIFDLVDKWIHLSGDAAADVSQSTSLESFINDPTPEQHLVKAIRSVRKLLENIAGGKNFDPLFSALQQCVIDVRNDPDLQQWLSDFLALVKKNLDTVGQIDSKETKGEREDLKKRWKRLTENADNKQWRDDAEVLRREFKVIQRRLDNDPDLQSIRRAHAQLGQDIEELFVDVAATGVQSLIDNAAWAWQDLFNVFVPRVLGVFKRIPIPRTEYKDPEIEFVLENLDISSFNLLPGHVFLRNITDVDISAPETGAAKTAVGSLTHLHVKGLQLRLDDISFYYKDKTATVGPSEYTGLVAVTLPPQGVDLDVKFRMIPNTPEGLKNRQVRQAFHRIEHINVSVNSDAKFEVKQSNHAVLLTVFKPLLNARLRDSLQTVLEEQVRGVLEAADHVAYDVCQRAQVFADAGLSRGPAVTAAFWSELGRLQRLPGGMFSGWQATGTGLVKDLGNNATLAMGAEPQVLAPGQRGPQGTLSEPLAQKMDRAAREAADQMNVDVPNVGDLQEGAKDAVDQARHGIKQGIRSVHTYQELVREKQRLEESRSGWQSDAFDV
ncbi:hypothetical protein K488DRAFT_84772 [Vararia minispora EC-137]|uniref:Uncharacterized protein n=1 Tax=Vararia minispora EC-137 TaxID=1314806 RepID=A0ACB8QPK4_9AGAM|nr:hypothetical protein K488DRAFT_84772 [Vararia minispora EC-137]